MIKFLAITALSFSMACAHAHPANSRSPRASNIQTAPATVKIWVDGSWAASGGRMHWVPGHWEVRPAPHRPNPRSVWVPGHHNKHGVWIPGHWR